MCKEALLSRWDRLRISLSYRYPEEVWNAEVSSKTLESWRDRAVVFLAKTFVLMQATARRFSNQEGMHLAAGVAFYSLLSLLPATILFVSILSYVTEPEEIVNWFVQHFGEETPVTLDFLDRAVDSAAALRGPLGIVGFLGTLLSSTLFFGAVMRSINRAWGLTGAGTRTFLRRKLWEFSLLVGMALLVLLAYVGTLLFKLVRHIDFPGTDLPLTGDSVFGTIVNNLFFLVAIAGVLMILYKFVPTVKVRWRYVLLPGAVTAAILVIVNTLLGWYIRHLGYYNVVYGSLASVIVLLVWTYVCANILIGGAAMSAAMADLEQQASGTDAAVDSKHPNTRNQQSAPG